MEKDALISREDVRKLFALARIEPHGEAEAEALARDLISIVAYVSSLPQDGGRDGYVEGVFNNMRDDGEPHEPGLYTRELLAAAPKSEAGYVRVRKVIKTE